MEKLPECVLIDIFEYLDKKTLLNATRTCET